MTRREAKRYVYGVAARILGGDANGWLVEHEDGAERPEAEQRMLQEALDQLVVELIRRAQNKPSVWCEHPEGQARRK